MGDMHLNYAYTAMETGDIEFLEYAMLAKNMYLEACKENKGRSQSWIGVGKSCFVLKEYQTAEEAFCVRVDLIIGSELHQQQRW